MRATVKSDFHRFAYSIPAQSLSRICRRPGVFVLAEINAGLGIISRSFQRDPARVL